MKVRTPDGNHDVYTDTVFRWHTYVVDGTGVLTIFVKAVETTSSFVKSYTACVYAPGCWTHVVPADRGKQNVV